MRLDLLSGLVLGLYAGRMLLEVLPNIPSASMTALAVLLPILLALPLVVYLHRCGLDVTPLLALSVYVLWPWLSPVLAVGCAAAVAVALVRANVWQASPRLHDSLLGLVALALYVHSLAPTILPADSGEFQFVSYVLGIAHPPGYPLYTLLAKLATCIPLGDVAYRVNLFSALTSTLALVVLGRAVRRATGSSLAGWVAAAGLGLSVTFWAQATTANIRSLTALFTAVQVGTLLAYAQSKDRRYLLGFAIAFGLGITHHGSTALLALPYAAFVFLSDPALLRNPGALAKPFLAFVLSFLAWLYLPLRSAMGAPFDPQPIRSLSGFLDHVLATGFRGDMFYFLQAGVLLPRLRVLFNILTFEFGPILLALAAWGAAHMAARQRRLLVLCGGVWAVNALTAIAYRAPQTVEYMMPAHVALAFLCAYGAWALSELVRVRAASSLLLAAALAVPLWLGARNYPSLAQLSQDRSARQYAEGLLRQAPQGARILSNWHYATPLWYLQYVEKLRPDVEVVYVYPEGATPMSEVWLRRIAESSAQRPTLVTNYFQELSTAPFQLRPLAGAMLVQTEPVFQAPLDIQSIDALFDGRIRLIGSALGDQRVAPAGSVTLWLYWQPTLKLDRDYSFFVHLVDEGGAVLGQGDVTHPAARYEVGQVIVDEYRLPLLPTVKPGRYALIAGVYITLPEGGWRRLTTANGMQTVSLGTVEVQPLQSAPVTLHVLDDRFACGYSLVGVDYDRSVAEQLRVYLHWRCDAPGPEQNAVLFSGSTTLAIARLPKAQPGTYLTTAHDLPAAASDLALELYDAADESLSVVRGPWRVAAGRRARLPAPAPQDRYVCLGGEMLLVRAEYPATFAPGSMLRTRMTFVGMKPILNDYTVSVSLTGEQGKWRAQYDGTPALGAIPTLKWLRGSTVVDEHDLQVPPDAAGRGTLRLIVYDAFTMRSLPVLDERLARLGQGTHIDLAAVQAR